MDSDLEKQPQRNASGLTRYRSAPSSYFNDVIDREFYEHIFNRPSSPETERVFSRFMNSLRGEEEEEESMDQIQKLASPKQEINQEEHANMAPSINNNNYEFYESRSKKPPLPNQNVNSGGGNNSNLIRHSSSPAGFFSQFNIENEYAAIRNMEALGAANNSMEEAKFSNARRLKNPKNYSSVRMSSIAEIGDKVNRENNPQSENFADESHGNDFMTGFGSWDDSSIVPDNIGGLKRFRDNDVKPFSGLNSAKTQNETGQSPAPLTHQMSLPNTSAEMAAIEKFLQFSDSVPCKIRAKRGCATHPRSIAERVRRTKISERMRKLQDLVPNMDKQTNTADMLDLAVDYIKDLQKQVQTLTDCHAKCTCSHEQHQ